MIYSNHFPADAEILRLAKHATFPATRSDIIRSAWGLGVSSAMLRFIALFDGCDLFESRLDFINRASEMKLFIVEGQSAPKELLRSP